MTRIPAESWKGFIMRTLPPHQVSSRLVTCPWNSIAHTGGSTTYRLVSEKGVPACTLVTVAETFCWAKCVSAGSSCHSDPYCLLFLLWRRWQCVVLGAPLHGLAGSHGWWNFLVMSCFFFSTNISTAMVQDNPSQTSGLQRPYGNKHLFYSLTYLHCCVLLPWLQVAWGWVLLCSMSFLISFVFVF